MERLADLRSSEVPPEVANPVNTNAFLVSARFRDAMPTRQELFPTTPFLTSDGHLSDYDQSGLGNCYVSIPNLKNLPMKLRMSKMIAPSTPHPSDGPLASRLSL